MNHRLKNSFLLLLLLPFALFSQTRDEASLRNDLADYFVTIKEKQVDKTIQYVYPKIFDQIAKEEMIRAMEQMYGDPEFQMEFENSHIDKIYEMLNHEGNAYTEVAYSFTLLMRFADTEEEESTLEEAEEEDDGFGEFMLAVFQEQFGKENVRYISESRTMEIKMKSAMFAIWDVAYPDTWKFIDKRKELMTQIKSIVPKVAWKHWKKNG